VCVCVCIPTRPSSLTLLDDTSQNFACGINESFVGMSSALPLYFPPPSSSSQAITACTVHHIIHRHQNRPRVSSRCTTAVTTTVGTLLLRCRWTNFALSAIIILLLILLSLSQCTTTTTTTTATTGISTTVQSRTRFMAITRIASANVTAGFPERYHKTITRFRGVIIYAYTD